MKEERFINVTGTDYIIHVLWGERPESPDYITYGFATINERRAFVQGVVEGDGWNGYVGIEGHRANKKLLEELRQAVQEKHPYLFEEEGA